MANRRLSTFYVPLLLYVVGLNVLVVAAATLLHELGHAALGHWLGCGNIEIVLFSSSVQSTFSRMACTAGTEPRPLAMVLSSFIFLLPLSGIFVVLDRFKERYLGHIVFGVGVMVAATDVRVLTGSPGIDVLVLLIGAVIALYGEERLINGIIATEIMSNADVYGGEAQK